MSKLAAWGWPIVGATPFIAWYIWLDLHPSFLGVMAFNGVVGGLAGGVGVGGAVLSLDDTGPSAPVWRWVLLGAALGAWCNTTLPYLLREPFAGLFFYDLLARGSWMLLGLALWGSAVRWGRSWAAWSIGVAVQPPLWVCLWGRGQTRSRGVVALLFVLLVGAGVGGWKQRVGNKRST